MHQFGCLSERGGGGGGNFLNLLQNEGATQKGGLPALEETMQTLKLTVSQNWTDGINWFFGTNSGKPKIDSIIFGWALSKMAVAF